MRIRCCSLLLPQDLIPPRLAKLQGRWPVALHVEYSVLALGQRDGLWFATFEHNEREMPVSAPLALFEVVDASVSPLWNVRMRGHEIALQPAELDEEFFCDDVQERRNDAFERYRAMKARLDGG
jgi:hypothetical protein